MTALTTIPAISRFVREVERRLTVLKDRADYSKGSTDRMSPNED